MNSGGPVRAARVDSAVLLKSELQLSGLVEQLNIIEAPSSNFEGFTLSFAFVPKR